MTRHLQRFIAICCCTFLGSCATNQPASIPADAVQSSSVESKNEGPANLSCAYFNFLWGTHAEFDEQYAEALEAYEKALTCDPQSEYVKEKIPVLLLKMGEFEKATVWLAQAIAEQPDNTTYRLLLANLYIQQDKIEDAINLYNEVLEKDPDNEGIQLRLAQLYTHQERYETAEEIFKVLLKKDIDSYFAHLYYARLLKQMDNPQEALAEYEKALTLNWSKELAYEIGYLYVDQEMFSDALRIYTTITEEDPFDEQAALSRIQALVDLQRVDDAINELRNIRLYSKSPANIDIIIAKLFLQKKEINKAKEILTKLTKEPASDEPRYILALLAYEEKDYDTSLTHLAHIGSGSDFFEDSVYLQTRIYQTLGKTEEAIHLLEKHIAGEANRSPLFYTLLSSLYQERGENLIAMNLMATAVDLYPDNYQLLFEYGLVLEKSGLSQKAIAVMERVLELQPDHAEALNYIGYTWADKNMNLDQALEYILQANELKPDNGFIIDSLGWVYYRLGDFQQAVIELERAVKLMPKDPHIFEHLGDAYRALKRFPEAIKSYKKAYKMFKEEKDKTTIQQKIDALQNL